MLRGSSNPELIQTKCQIKLRNQIVSPMIFIDSTLQLRTEEMEKQVGGHRKEEISLEEFPKITERLSKKLKESLM